MGAGNAPPISDIRNGLSHDDFVPGVEQGAKRRGADPGMTNAWCDPIVHDFDATLVAADATSEALLLGPRDGERAAVGGALDPFQFGRSEL
ncbi:hypothetical protein X759_22535 [Mesorhizobium sp. LSHC420B00]|nr:hypothetical protein X759_22535 [Mesorhizobium sp. LSHC420B00]